MNSKILQTSLYESENQTELSIREAYALLHHRLKPPFSLSIPSPSEYSQLNRAIAYGILTEPQFAKTHFTHLTAIVTDGYEFFVNSLVKIVIELYPKLLESAQIQLLWVCSKLVDVSAIGVENLLVSLLRQINVGDFSHPNLWLAMELIRVLSGNWDWVLSEPLVLTSGLFTYLRLLADHYRLSGPELDALKRSEIEFCIRVLRECFGLCLRIGRDLIRLLQDLVYIPEFGDVWKDLLSNAAVFRVPGFSDISQIYHSRTSSRYFLLRITPEMETQLRFLLTHVNWGSQKRYQMWFAKKYFCTPERETIICDIVRFICCAHHPTNEIIQSNIISRWAVIGWLLKCCRKNHVEANAKLALFYDWLFFDEKVDNIMNIEPAILLMVNSIPKYIDMTHTLLEFLFLLVDNYDINRKDIIVRGVSASFDTLLRKGVICSFETLISCSSLSPLLKEKLCTFIPSLKSKAVREASADLHHYLVPLNLPSPSDVEIRPLNLLSPSDLEIGPLTLQSSSDVEIVPLNLSSQSDVGSGKRSFKSLDKCNRKNGFLKNNVEARVQVLDSPIANTPTISKKRKIGMEGSLLHDLKAIIKQSKKLGLDTLEKILFSYAALNDQAVDIDTMVGVDSDYSHDAFAFQIMEALKLTGYAMFSPLKCPLKEMDYDDEIQSATALVMRTFIFSPHERMTELILFWCKNGHPVGPRLLSYVSRLANDAHAMSGLTSSIDRENHINYRSHGGGLLNGYAMMKSNKKNSDKEIILEKSLLKCHVDGYISFMNVRGKDASNSIVSTSTVNVKLISQLVEDAFVAYRNYLKLCSIKQPSSHFGTFSSICQTEDCTHNISSNGMKGTDQTLVASLFSDLMSCCGWQVKRSRLLFHSIFCHLSDLSTAREDFVRLLVDRLDHADLVATQFDVGLRRLSLFGGDTVIICHLVRSTLTWDFVEQQKFWGLLISELAVSKVQAEKIVMNLCSDFLDPREDSVAVGGLLTLSRCCSPTLELVGTIISLPNVFGDFAAAVLASWVASSSLVLFNSLSEWLQKLNNKYDGSVSFKHLAAKINYFAIAWLLNFLDTDSMKSANGESALSDKVSDVKAKLANIMVVYDAQMLQNRSFDIVPSSL